MYYTDVTVLFVALTCLNY